MKKTTSSLCFLLAASVATVSAADVKIVKNNIRLSETKEITLPEGVEFACQDMGGVKHLTPIKRSNASAELVTVTVKAVNGTPGGGSIYNKSLKEQIWFTGNQSKIQVPKGNYDIFVNFGTVA